MKRKTLDFDLKENCSRCGSFEVEEKSSGAIKCKNCGTEEFFCEENNTLYIKRKIRWIE